MSPALFVACMRALYGDTWRANAANQTGIAERNLRRWEAGERPIPDSLIDEMLLPLLHQRADTITSLIAALEEE
jgi:hypothetical protein